LEIVTSPVSIRSLVHFVSLKEHNHQSIESTVF
jgi:hypothetical protein